MRSTRALNNHLTCNQINFRLIPQLKIIAMKKFIIILLVLVMFQTKNYAQSFYTLQDKFMIGYEVGISSNDFISSTSWRGGRIEYRHMIKPNISVGISGSWN